MKLTKEEKIYEAITNILGTYCKQDLDINDEATYSFDDQDKEEIISALTELLKKI